MRPLYIFRACYVFSLLFCLIDINASAQSDTIPLLPTGDVEAMSIFGQYPQISYTGVPDINIPLYNFTYEGLSLPLVLSYNNNLVKPYSTGSWVGLGWNLSAGGLVSRTVNGKPDDLNWYKLDDYNKTNDTQMGYYYNHSYLSDTNWADSSRMQGAFNDLYDTFHYSSHSGITSPTMRDYAPDEFYFSVADISGYFYLDDQGNWKVKSTNKVKVVISSSDFDEVSETSPIPNQKYIKKITLIDNRGIKFIFGGSDNKVDAVKSSSTDPNLFIDAWYISDIVFPNGKYITFNYASGTDVTFSQPVGFQNGYVIHSTQVNHTTHLTQIQTDLYQVSFITSQQSNHTLELDTLKIANANNINDAEIKKFAFSYTYTKTKSIKLTDVKQLTSDNHIGPRYAFGYNAKSFDSLSVHGNTDAWGYYNTKGFKADYGGYFNWDVFSHSRSRDTAYCRAELLERITYPTGGYTLYTWEPNFCNSAVNETNTLLPYLAADSIFQPGGVRIKSIANFDNNDQKLGSKRYFYVKNFNLSGLDTASSSGIVHQTLRALDIPFGFWQFATLSYVFGAESHVNYSEVTEMSNDGSYIITKYSNSDNGYGNAPDVKYIAGGDNDINPIFGSSVQERGAPLDIKTFSNLGNLLNEKIYSYTTVIDGNPNDYVRAYFLHVGSNYGGYTVSDHTHPIQTWYGSAYQIFINNFLPATITEKQYNNTGNAITATSTLTYDVATANLTKMQVSNSKRQTEETDYLYPSEMVSSSQDPTGIYTAMKTANVISPVIETIKKVGGTQISLSKTDYKSLNIGYTVYKPDSVCVKYGTNNLETTNKYVAYDDKGRLVTELKNNIVPTTYIYGLNSNLVVAKVDNATENEIFHEDFEAPSDADVIKKGAAHSGVQYFLGDYIPNFQIPDSKNYIISFWYHDSGNIWKYKEQPYVRFQTILPVDANALDDICIYPTDALISTYAYNTLGGLISETDAAGHTTHYDYDDFQRLVNIKDQDGNIKTHYCYNYAGEETDCAVSTISEPTAIVSATGIYARMEISNLRHDDGVDNTDLMGDVCVKFYADPNATIPLTLTSNLDVLVYMPTVTKYDGEVIETDPDWEMYTVSAGNNSYCLGTIDLDYISEETDENDIIHYTEFINTVDLTPGYTLYTVLPLVTF